LGKYLKLNKRQHDYWFPQIVAKQGGKYCARCGLTQSQLEAKGFSPQLCIHHSKDVNQIEFMLLYCVSCNLLADHPRNKIDSDRQPSPEMLKARKLRKRISRYCIQRVNDQADRDELIDDIANYFDSSQETIKRHLRSLTSKKHGIFEWKEGNEGQEYLRFKNDADMSKVAKDEITYR